MVGDEFQNDVNHGITNAVPDVALEARECVEHLSTNVYI